MKKLLMMMSAVVLAACGPSTVSNDDENLTLMPKFDSTWNIYESFVNNEDGTITYHALPWGGLVGSVKERNMPVDWSGYESVTFEFAEPTTVSTQIMISDELKTLGKKGITSLTCYFDGHDLSSVGEVALQYADTGVVIVKNVYLTPATGRWESAPIWQGECALGHWEKGFVVPAEKFENAQEGDKLEIIYKSDQSNPEVKFWLLKTTYNETDSTLCGNDNELNDWGCVLVSKDAANYRIVLTGKDVVNLRKKGLFVNGYYNNVTQVNLVKKVMPQADV